MGDRGGNRVQIRTHERTLSVPFNMRVRAYARDGEGISGFSVTPLTPPGQVTECLKGRIAKATNSLEKLIEEAGEDYLTMREMAEELPPCAHWCVERGIAKTLADIEDAHFAEYGQLWGIKGYAKPAPHPVKRGAA